MTLDLKHQNGQQAELLVAARFAQHGFIVSKPWLTQCAYDLVVDGGGTLRTVQVKRATWSKSGPHSYLQARLDRGKKRLDSKVDLFAFTDGTDVWCAYASELRGMTSVCLSSTNPDYRAYTNKKYKPDEWRI